MKKALLFATLALSINAFAQTNKPAFNLLLTKIITLEKVHRILDDKELKTSGNIKGMTLIKKLHNREMYQQNYYSIT
jgi:hypothetical protein